MDPLKQESRPLMLSPSPHLPVPMPDSALELHLSASTCGSGPKNTNPERARGKVRSHRYYATAPEIFATCREELRFRTWRSGSPSQAHVLRSHPRSSNLRKAENGSKLNPVGSLQCACSTNHANGSKLSLDESLRQACSAIHEPFCRP